MCLSFSVPAFATNDCTEGHTPPARYEYYKTVNGNTDEEITLVSTAAGGVSLCFPSTGAIIFVTTAVYNVLYLWNPGHEGRGDYTKEIYYDRSSSGFWEHTEYYGKDTKGIPVYLGCQVDRHWVSNDPG